MNDMEADAYRDCDTLEAANKLLQEVDAIAYSCGLDVWRDGYRVSIGGGDATVAEAVFAAFCRGLVCGESGRLCTMDLEVEE